MLPRNHLDRVQIVFDDHRLVNNAGLILPATLALHLGLSQLVDRHLDLGRAPGRANTGDKMMTLVASALAGGDCIDAADVLRTGGTACTLGCVVKAPSTLGASLRSFRWGQVRQLDRVSRELLARAWAAGAGPGDAPFTIDLDSTICETYELAYLRRLLDKEDMEQIISRYPVRESDALGEITKQFSLSKANYEKTLLSRIRNDGELAEQLRKRVGSLSTALA